MLFRLAVAYGAVQAVLASVVLGAASLVVGLHLVGITRQPLPLAWPLAVLLALATQLPLREVLPPMERVGFRAAHARAAGGGAALILAITSWAVGTATTYDPSLQIFFLLLCALGYVAASLAPGDGWVVVLAAGMGWVSVQFTTPWGGAMGQALTGIGRATAAAALVSAYLVYVLAPRRPALRRLNAVDVVPPLTRDDRPS